MNDLSIEQSIRIKAKAELVRWQFADVAHHQRTAPHKGVRFEVLEQDQHRCRYRQTSRVGPLRLNQEIELARADCGPLVNTITKGWFRGGTISFVIRPADADGEAHSTITARLDAPLRGPQRLLAGVLKHQVSKALSRALAEDKADLESGAYSN